MTDRKALNSSGRQDVQAFLKDVRALARPKDNASSGRLVFALDATASREASWDKASALHAEMFQAASACGGTGASSSLTVDLIQAILEPWRSSILLAHICARANRYHRSAGGHG